MGIAKNSTTANTAGLRGGWESVESVVVTFCDPALKDTHILTNILTEVEIGWGLWFAVWLLCNTAYFQSVCSGCSSLLQIIYNAHIWCALIRIYNTVCLNTWFWLDGRCALKLCNAQIVPVCLITFCINAHRSSLKHIHTNSHKEFEDRAAHRNIQEHRNLLPWLILIKFKCYSIFLFK